MRLIRALAAVFFLTPLACRAQAAGSPPRDSTDRVFRDVIDSVASTAALASLRDAALPPGVRREVRAYVGFGLMSVQQILRIRDEEDGVSGWLGLWWPGERLPYQIPDATEAQYAAARQARAAQVARLRERIADLGCTEFHARTDYETCTLPTPGIAWASVLARLDDLGVARLPQQPEQYGLDGVTLVIEYRDGSGYRAYSYWTPSHDVENVNERAAAAIMDLIGQLPCQAGLREACTLTTQ
jgi:hypothetical protein